MMVMNVMIVRWQWMLVMSVMILRWQVMILVSEDDNQAMRAGNAAGGQVVVSQVLVVVMGVGTEMMRVGQVMMAQ